MVGGKPEGDNRSIQLGGLGKPKDVAAAVLVLVSEQASFIRGEALDVNGGALMD